MPVLKNKSMENYNIKCLWSKTLQHSFSAMFVKKIFRHDEYSLVTGSEHGNVKVYKAISKNEQIIGFEEVFQNYETKGDSIHILQSENVTKFSSNDILVGDDKGMLTIFTNGQILNRRNLCKSSIAGVVLDTDAAGNTLIMVASVCGSLVAVTPYDIVWRCRLAEVLNTEDQEIDSSLTITAIHVLRVQSGSTDATYLLVADSAKRIHLFQNGRLVMSFDISSVVTSMCTGNFVNQAKPVEATKAATSPAKSQRFSNEEQVAMATKSGAIYILVNFQIIPYANFSYPLSTVKRLLSSVVDDVDSILCCGHFNKLCILRNGELVGSYHTEDWIHALDVISPNSAITDSTLLCVGCVNNSIKLLQVQ